METKKLVATIRQFNAWRRDDAGDSKQPDPRKIGEALDLLCARVEAYEAVMQAASVLIATKGRHNTALAYQGLADALTTQKS